jgi:hypothetical protein
MGDMIIRQEGADAEYSPMELYGGTSTINFNTPTVVTVTRHSELVTRVSGTEIELQSGKCPSHYEAAKSDSGLATIRLTAPVGWRLVYTTKAGKRKVNTPAGTCGSWSWEGESAVQYLDDGSAVEIKPQRAGSGPYGYLWGKKVYLKDVVTFAPPPPPPAETQTCPDGSVIAASATCPPPKVVPPIVPPYVPPVVPPVVPPYVLPQPQPAVVTVLGLEPIHILALAGIGIAGVLSVTAYVVMKGGKEGKK